MRYVTYIQCEVQSQFNGIKTSACRRSRYLVLSLILNKNPLHSKLFEKIYGVHLENWKFDKSQLCKILRKPLKFNSVCNSTAAKMVLKNSRKGFCAVGNFSYSEKFQLVLCGGAINKNELKILFFYSA